MFVTRSNTRSEKDFLSYSKNSVVSQKTEKNELKGWLTSVAKTFILMSETMREELHCDWLAIMDMNILLNYSWFTQVAKTFIWMSGITKDKLHWCWLTKLNKQKLLDYSWNIKVAKTWNECHDIEGRTVLKLSIEMIWWCCRDTSRLFKQSIYLETPDDLHW